MTLDQIMTKPVLTVRPSDPASDALARMRDERVRHAVVLDGELLIGVVSERDLGGPNAAALRIGKTVADFMRAAPELAWPSMRVAEAALRMREGRIGCLPVVGDGVLVGIVTRSDLLDALGHRRRSERPQRADPFRPSPLASPNRDKRL
jgi:acetoin utilization protein AcuB